MKSVKWILIYLLITGTMVSCVSKKKYVDIQSKHKNADESLSKCSDDLLSSKQHISKLKSDLDGANITASNTSNLREDQIRDLKNQNIRLAEK
jgi:hypothetical protein